MLTTTSRIIREFIKIFCLGIWYCQTCLLKYRISVLFYLCCLVWARLSLSPFWVATAASQCFFFYLVFLSYNFVFFNFFPALSSALNYLIMMCLVVDLFLFFLLGFVELFGCIDFYQILKVFSNYFCQVVACLIEHFLIHIFTWRWQNVKLV